MSDLKHQMDSEEYGGAPFLGAKQPVIKAHGSSKAKGIKNAIRQAKICVEKRPVRHHAVRTGRAGRSTEN